MAEPTIDIERVVREVLARLGESLEGEAPPADRPAPEEGTLVVDSRVVTSRDIDGKLDGIRRLVVPPGGVVTPSVRDELRARGVVLEHGSLGSPAGPGRARLALALVGSRQDPGSLLRDLEAEPVQVEVSRYDCLVAATAAVAAAVARPDCLAAVLTGHPALALCLANRHRGVRAVWGTDPARLAPDLDSVGANVLVVDPRSVGPYPFRQMMIQFCRRGPQACPQEVREQLG